MYRRQRPGHQAFQARHVPGLTPPHAATTNVRAGRLRRWEEALGERTLIRGGIVFPLEGRRVVHDPGSVLIDGAEIVAVGAIDHLDGQAEGAALVDATDHAVIPGLHNCHLHSGLLRGTAESMSL